MNLTTNGIVTLKVKDPESTGICYFPIQIFKN